MQDGQIQLIGPPVPVAFGSCRRCAIEPATREGTHRFVRHDSSYYSRRSCPVGSQYRSATPLRTSGLIGGADRFRQLEPTSYRASDGLQGIWVSLSETAWYKPSQTGQKTVRQGFRTPYPQRHLLSSLTLRFSIRKVCNKVVSSSVRAAKGEAAAAR